MAWTMRIGGMTWRRTTRIYHKGRLLGGTPPNTPFERMEVFMEGLFFAIGFLLGGVVGVLIMCLLQINRIGRKEDSEE